MPAQQLPSTNEIFHFAVYGTLRDDCDTNSQQDWTSKFIQDMSNVPRTAKVYGMKLVYKRSLAENWPYAVSTDSPQDSVTVRLLEFKPNWAEKLKEADGVEQYDPEHPDSSPMGYKRRVVEAHFQNEDGNTEITHAVMYYIDSFDQSHVYYDIPSGDWIQRDMAYHNIGQ